MGAFAKVLRVSTMYVRNVYRARSDSVGFHWRRAKDGNSGKRRIREQKQQKYLRNKSYLHDVTLTAEPYMYWIAGQAKKRNMPMELVSLLPIVESALILFTHVRRQCRRYLAGSYRAQGAIMV